MRFAVREVGWASQAYWDRCDELEGGILGENLAQDEREELLYGYGRHLASGLMAGIWEREGAA